MEKSDIGELLAYLGCDCDEYRELGDHECLAGKAEAEWMALKDEHMRRGSEIRRLNSALSLIAEGRLSPAISFAREVLAGKTAEDAYQVARGGER